MQLNISERSENRLNEPQFHTYEFGNFRLDAARRQLLRRDGKILPLKPKVFDTLLYFVRHPGKVLEKEELMREIWPDAFVEENNLNQNVSTLRRVLGESRGENRFIVTLPGRGYRFAADVKALIKEAPMDSPELVTRQVEGARSDSKPRRRKGKLRDHVSLVRFVGVVAALLAVGAFYLWRAQKPGTDTPIRTIAVLPFKPLVVENRNESLEMGMADTLIAKLSSIKEVTVRPLTSVRKYDGPEQNSIEAGRELGVEAVLDGTIQRWGNRIRVTVRLVRVSDEKQLWDDHFDEDFTDIFSLQDSICERVMRELALELSGEERELLAKRYTADPEAYELYLKGRFFWNQRTRQGTRQAIEYFQHVLERDPNYALAYAGLADCYRSLPIRSDVPSREAFPKAKQAALKALEIDKQLAEAHTTLGWIKFYFDWDWEGSEKEFRQAVEINPNYPLAHLGYAHLLANLGRHEEAQKKVDRALSLDPLSGFAGVMKAQFLFHARRYPNAKDQLQKTLEIEPNFWIGQLLLGSIHQHEGRYEEALEAFRKAKEFSGGATQGTSLIAYTYAVSGQRREAGRILHELKSISQQRYVPPYNIAMVYNGLGNSDETLRWLEKAYEERDVHLVFLGVDPRWDALRSDPGFISLLKRINLIK
jgi:DNA-binding winged helix-turn-helix (wHTH) protein/TolB-like protein/Tfp pilus assembly protein PilF